MNSDKNSKHNKRTKVFNTTMVLFLGLAVAACVSQKKYDAALSEIASLKVDSMIQDYQLTATEVEKQMTINEQQEQLEAQAEKIDSLRAIVDRQSARMQKAATLLQDFNDKGWSFEAVEGRLFIDLSNEVLFASGESELSDAGQELAERLATVIKEMEGTNVWVIGHTDNEPFVTNTKDNWDLSADRALSVSRALVKFGVNPDLITASAKSKYDPQASNKTEIGKKLNRRTEIILEPNETIESEFYDLLSVN